MICPKCKGRWAPFPKNDFQFIIGKGFVSKNLEAEHNRNIVFNADNYEYCGCEDDDWEFGRHYITRRSTGQAGSVFPKNETIESPACP